MAAKFKEAVKEMMAMHQAEFEEFKRIHELFTGDKKKWSAEYNRTGKPIVDYVLAAEKRLCSKSESSGYGAYSTKLSEKFREEVKTHFPLIDFVGVTFS